MTFKKYSKALIYDLSDLIFLLFIGKYCNGGGVTNPVVIFSGPKNRLVC
jgi:hypothetical protein